MRLTRKFLTALGVSSESADQIIDAHVETVDALKEERDKLKADAERLPVIEKELKELKEASEGQDGKNPFELKYNELKQEFETFKSQTEAKELKATKEGAYRKLLASAGLSEKLIEKVLKVTNMDDLELDENNKFKDEKKLTDSIKDEWGDFVTTTKTVGAQTATPPSNNGGKTTMTREQIIGMKDGVARRKAMAENPELFGLSTE